MARFVYEAKSGPKDIVRGSLVADTRTAAIQKIGQMGYFLLSIEEEQEALSQSDRYRAIMGRRVSLKDLTDFTRQLSDLLEAGITIAKALDILQEQTLNKRLKPVIADVRDHCVSGNPLSSALARHPKIFSRLYVSMVLSGESGGMLEAILKRLADFSEKELEVQTKVRTALAYPALMALVGLGTVMVLITFVIPKLTVMFSDFGQALPLPTQILLGISDIVRSYWLLLIGAAALAVMALNNIYRTREGRLSIDRMKLNSPVFGQLIKKVEIARFARTLSTLLENGVPILDALGIVMEIVENAVIRADIEKASSAVREGSSLARGLSSSAVIPTAVTSMISIGEESGHVERSLLKVAVGYERESDEAIKVMMSLLEPVLILTLGAIVGFIVISMLLPIFEMNFLVR